MYSRLCWTEIKKVKRCLIKLGLSDCHKNTRLIYLEKDNKQTTYIAKLSEKIEKKKENYKKK